MRQIVEKDERLAPTVASCRGVRPMRAEDLTAVARLFNKVFRGRSGDPSPDQLDYLHRLFFESPVYDPAHGSIVHVNASGGIDSALLALPMTFSMGGQEITARLLCAFMADGKAGLAGAARLARAIRVSQPDFCFSDNASPVSADHWTTGGGMMLPVQSLQWRRTFRPIGSCLEKAGAKITWLRPMASSLPVRLADGLIRSRLSAFTMQPVSGWRSRNATSSDFRRYAEEMTERFWLRPAWTTEEVRWLMDGARLNRTLGELQCRIVSDAAGKDIGCLLYFRNPGRTAEVLDVLASAGHETEVVAHMLHELDHEGHVAARGMSQPFLMNALMRNRRMRFRHRGYFCMVSRHDDLRRAAASGDIYVGGLASESWSRLLSDFH
ncbi:GNAT family N-acetyltransferase [Pseudorhizobium endolithicum]|uniref:GNAT family N-acetyltransferase n=1 Tax=Pseudorhizobium endolithicum TaxID=1191678 RepID=A0ABN7JPV2_9HYPH|nr:GNAT family N-acetyltransferase [Pseudorhizobium endolithicum]CAD7039274.1 GNAT family N-acetyltransferase [Pseudorhizobium endolithicum]